MPGKGNLSGVKVFWVFPLLISFFNGESCLTGWGFSSYCKQFFIDIQSWVMRATKAVIHLENLRHNILEIKKIVSPGVRLCVPVKADGYGHGAAKVAVAAIRAGASFLAVASIQEGIDLRNAGIVAPILSLSLPTPEEIPGIIANSITPLVFDSEFISDLGIAAKKMNRVIPVHLKIDTGMGRIGCFPEDSVKIAKLVSNESHLFLEGVCTHLAVSDSLDKDDIEFTRLQIKRFEDSVKNIREAGINPGIVHCSASGGVLQYPEAHFDMVRPGILIYGYSPSKELNAKINLKPVMELVTKVVSIRKVPAGTSISYGRKWIAGEDTFIGTLPVGYADGLLRKLSPGLCVLIKGKKYPVVGRICMDQCMINLGNSGEVQRWDDAVIFGPDPMGNSAENLAELLDTIPYEVTCGINKRVPRIYTGTEDLNPPDYV